MKTYTKTTRITEIMLVLFIVSFFVRAAPNWNDLPAFNSEYQEIGDQEWGRVCRIAFQSTNPPRPGKARPSKIAPEWKSPKTFPVLPKQLWLWHRDFEA
jgi:quinol-cytochrome oxidoreductase complex cytochrome b subunit